MLLLGPLDLGEAAKKQERGKCKKENEGNLKSGGEGSGDLAVRVQRLWGGETEGEVEEEIMGGLQCVYAEKPLWNRKSKNASCKNEN